MIRDRAARRTAGGRSPGSAAGTTAPRGAEVQLTADPVRSYAMDGSQDARAGWQVFALGSALFAALTAILGKLGVSEVNSDLATLIRTAVIIVVTAGIVSARGEGEPLGRLSRFGADILVV